MAGLGPDRVPDEADCCLHVAEHREKAEAAECRLAALPEAFKAEFGAAGRVERVEVVLRWLEKRAGKEKAGLVERRHSGRDYKQGEGAG